MSLEARAVFEKLGRVQHKSVQSAGMPAPIVVAAAAIAAVTEVGMSGPCFASENLGSVRRIQGLTFGPRHGVGL